LETETNKGRGRRIRRDDGRKVRERESKREKRRERRGIKGKV
jgi:hypothetical protein